MNLKKSGIQVGISFGRYLLLLMLIVVLRLIKLKFKVTVMSSFEKQYGMTITAYLAKEERQAKERKKKVKRLKKLNHVFYSFFWNKLFKNILVYITHRQIKIIK